MSSGTVGGGTHRPITITVPRPAAPTTQSTKPDSTSSSKPSSSNGGPPQTDTYKTASRPATQSKPGKAAPMSPEQKKAKAKSDALESTNNTLKKMDFGTLTQNMK